jgi:nucleoid-associated protein YgaU
MGRCPGAAAAASLDTMAFPFISVRHPRPHDIVDDPVEVAGVGTGFEGTLSARLRDHAGNQIAEHAFAAGGTGIWGNFFFRIDVPGLPGRARGTLEVFESSAKDGSDLHKQVIPIVFGRALVDPFAGFSVHTVRAGDTLAAIADRFYGDPAKFRIIFAANRDLLDDPDVIVPGQELRIPQ